MHNRNTDIALLLLRLAFGGAMLLAHGWPKLMKVVNGNFQFGDPIGIGEPASLILAAFAEAICALLVTIGLFTRLALVPLIITMLVAFLVVHGGDPWGKMEGSFTFLIPYIALLLTGPGYYSLDERFFSGRI